MQERPAMVQIYSPERPLSPMLIHPGNFNPDFGHRRWEYRPTAVQMAWQPVVLLVLGIPAALDIAADVPDAGDLRERHALELQAAALVVDAIDKAGIRSIEDMAAISAIPGVAPDTLRKLGAWANAQPIPIAEIKPAATSETVVEALEPPALAGAPEQPAGEIAPAEQPATESSPDAAPTQDGTKKGRPKG